MLADLVIWSADDVLQVPIGALFRAEGDWAVFAVNGERADLRPIRVGQINDQTAQVLDGLNPGDTVILYPNDLLEDGTLVAPR